MAVKSRAKTNDQERSVVVGLLGCNDPEVVEEGSCAGQQVVCLACLNLRVGIK